MPEANERLARIETIVEDIHERLFGNGQPGELEKIDQRLTALEHWRWWLIGLAIGVGVASGALGSKILEAIR